MPNSTETLQFQCHRHQCNKVFPKAVNVVDAKDKSSCIVKEIVNCPYCQQPCQIELFAHQVSTTSVFRSGDSAAILPNLEGKVFPTRPVPV
jgi:hypothetical protein